jgi:hypothetical protein
MSSLKRSRTNNNNEDNKEVEKDQNLMTAAFVNRLHKDDLFLHVPADWHSGANDREQQFRRSLGAWVNGHKHDASDKAIAERLSRHVRYVTDSEFRSAFRDSVAWAIDAMRSNFPEKSKNIYENKEPVVKVEFASVPYKSSAWLNKVAWDIMSSRHADPKMVLSRYIIMEEVEDDVSFKVSRVRQNPLASIMTLSADPDQQHVLYCDDASYSGQQMYMILEALLRDRYDIKKTNSSKVMKLKHMHIYVVVPFVSTHAYQRFLKLQSFSKKANKGTVSGTLETGTVMTFHLPFLENGTITVHLNPVASKNTLVMTSSAVRNVMGNIPGPLNSEDEHTYTETTLTTFNHKTPDEISFFPKIYNGQLIRGGKFQSLNDVDLGEDWVRFLNESRSAYKTYKKEKKQKASI